MTAIASSSRLRSPTTETPMSLRSSTVSRGSRSASILLSRNFSSYWPSPRPRSHPPTSIAAPHWLSRMIAQTRRRVQQPRSLPLGAEKLFKLRFDQPSKDGCFLRRTCHAGWVFDSTVRLAQPGVVLTDTEGRIVELNWRATHILTGRQDLAIVPNSTIAKSKIVNLNYPSAIHGITIEVRLSAPPAS